MINENDLWFWTCQQCWWTNWRFRPESAVVSRIDEAIKVLESLKGEINGIDLVIGLLQVYRGKMFSSVCRHCTRLVDIQERPASHDDLREIARAMRFGQE